MDVVAAACGAGFCLPKLKDPSDWPEKRLELFEDVVGFDGLKENEGLLLSKSDGAAALLDSVVFAPNENGESDFGASAFAPPNEKLGLSTSVFGPSFFVAEKENALLPVSTGLAPAPNANCLSAGASLAANENGFSDSVGFGGSFLDPPNEKAFSVEGALEPNENGFSLAPNDAFSSLPLLPLKLNVGAAAAASGFFGSGIPNCGADGPGVSGLAPKANVGLSSSGFFCSLPNPVNPVLLPNMGFFGSSVTTGNAVVSFAALWPNENGAVFVFASGFDVPNEKDGADVASGLSVSVLVAPNEKFDVVGVPNENFSADFAGESVVLAPNLNVGGCDDGCDESDDAFGFGVSHEAHFAIPGTFCIIHTSHVHLP